jgi:hypothetical protein
MAGDGPIDTVRETIVFLRKSAAELRQIADGSDPGMAQQLRRMADQCDAEANDLSERSGSHDHTGLP